MNKKRLKIDRALFFLLLAYMAVRMSLGAGTGKSDAPVKGKDLVGSAHLEVTDLGNGQVRLERMSYDADQTELEIPSEIDGKQVTVLGNEALKAEMKPAETKGTLVQLRKSSLESVKIPAGVEKIEGNPFSACPALKKIEVDEENSAFLVQNSMLIDQEKRTVIAMPRGLDGEADVPSDILRIGEKAFYACMVSSVALPEGLEEIGSNAFGFCTELHEVRIPGSVTSFGEDPFDSTGTSMPGQYYLLKQGQGAEDYPFQLLVIAGSAGEDYAAEGFLPYKIVDTEG